MLKVIFQILLSAFIFVGCNNPSQTINGDKKTEDAKPSVATQQSESNLQVSKYSPSYKDICLKSDFIDSKKIAAQLFDLYIKEYKDARVDDFERILDYAVEEIRIVKGDINEFQFFASYSVYPVSSKYAIIGNGKKESDGWIRHKNIFMSIKKEAEGYKIREIGTAPLS